MTRPAGVNRGPRQLPPLHLMDGVSGEPVAEILSEGSESKFQFGEPRKLSCSRLYLATTTVVQELLSLGRSRLGAIRTSILGRTPRMIGQ